MIELIFERTPEIILIKIDGKNVTFSNSIQGNIYSSIDNLKLDYEGVIKEHPDLENREDWNKEAIKRFKQKIKSYEKEEEISDYIIKELMLVGYRPMYRKKQGFRREDLQ